MSVYVIFAKLIIYMVSTKFKIVKSMVSTKFKMAKSMVSAKFAANSIKTLLAMRSN